MRQDKRRHAAITTRTQSVSPAKKRMGIENDRPGLGQHSLFERMKDPAIVEASFEHDDITSKLCPEARGHFCMLWGEHGHGGYDSQARGYLQGGQPMDETFELMGIYLDFEEAKAENDWQRMRLAIAELKQMRAEMNISRAQERELREES